MHASIPLGLTYPTDARTLTDRANTSDHTKSASQSVVRSSQLSS
jgi:hypothetical protein